MSMVLCMENLAEQNPKDCPGALPSPGNLTLTSTCLVSAAQQKGSPGVDRPLQPGQEEDKDLFLPTRLCLQGLTRSLGQSCWLAEKIRRVVVPTLPLSIFCLCPQHRGCLTLLLGTGPVSSPARSGGDHKCWRAIHLGLFCWQDGEGLKSCFLHHQTLPKTAHLQFQILPCRSTIPTGYLPVSKIVFKKGASKHINPQELNTQESPIRHRAGASEVI